MSGPRVVAVGGGHGLAMSLKAIATYAGHTTAVVATSDDGGSSGRLRAELGMAAPGDLRRCLTSVAPDRSLAESLEHRFSAGELSGHAVGNLVLAGLVDAGNDLVAAADHLSRWLRIDPAVVRVLPATHEPVAMVGTTSDGEVRGQVALEGTSGITAIAIDPPDPKVPDEVVEAIGAAAQVVLGPGSFHTSVLAAAVVPGIRDALRQSAARTVFVCNLRAEEPEVRGFDVAHHLAVLHDHGIDVDVVVAQDDGLPVGDTGPVEVVLADIDRPHGLAHDADLLGGVLSGLC